MKKRLSFVLIAILVVILVMSMVLVACKKKDENGNEVTLSSIKLSTSSLTLDNGSTVDTLKSQIAVTAVYSDGSETPITDFEISGFDPAVVGEAQTVTVTYQGQTYTLTVTVQAGAPVVVTPSFTATVGDNNVNFVKGEGNVYVARVTLTKGQEIVIKDADGNPVALGEFGGVATVDGEYVFTLTVGETIAVTVDVPQAPVVDEPSYVAKVGDEEVAFVKGEQGYTATVTLNVGDEVEVFDNEDQKLSFDGDFDGVATVEGEYVLNIYETADVVFVTIPQKPVVKVGYTAYVGDDASAFIEVEDGVFSLTLTLNVGDQVVVKDGENNVIEFSDNFKGSVIVEGSYKFDISPVAALVRVTLPQVQPEGPVYYIVATSGNVSFVKNDEQTAYEEYVASVYLTEGETVSIVDDKGATYDSFENDFDGTAKVEGSYTFYLKLQDTGATVYVAVPAQQEEGEYVIVINDGEAKPFVKNGDLDEYMYSTVLSVGDVVVIKDIEGTPVENYENVNVFNGTAKVEGNYTFYLKVGETLSVYTAAPTSNAKATVYYFNSNHWNAVHAYAWEGANEYLGEWPGATMAPLADQPDWYFVEVSVNAVNVKFSGFDGEETGDIAIDSFDAPYYKDGVWYASIPEDVQPEVTKYFVEYSVDGEVKSFELTKNKAQTDYVEYAGEETLPANVSVAVKDNKGGVYDVYENEFNGATVVEGKYGFYLKLYDSGAMIYVAIPSNDDPDYAYALFVNDDFIDTLEEEDGDYGKQFVAEVKVSAGDFVEIKDAEGNNVVRAKEYTFKEVNDGTMEFVGRVSVDGLFNFYLKESEQTVWFSFVPAEEPDFEYAVLVNGDLAAKLEKNEKFEPKDGYVVEYMATGIKEGKVQPGDAVIVTLVDKNGNEYDLPETMWNYTTEARETFEIKEGTYELYLKLTEGDAYLVDVCFTPAEVSDKVVLYYYNSKGWNVVYAYAWSGEGNAAVNYLGEWPGAAMESTDVEGWLVIEVSAKAQKIIFNDNGENKTYDLELNFDTPYFFEGEWYEEMPSNEPDFEYAVLVNGDLAAKLEKNEKFEPKDGYVVEYMATGIKEGKVQPGDAVIVTLVDKNGNEYDLPETMWNYTTEARETFEIKEGTYELYLKLTEGDAYLVDVCFTPAEVSDKVVLYYYNSKGWNVVYAYAWSGEGNAAVNYLGEWAGTQMSAAEDLGEGWFCVEVDAAATNVIFNDGSDQTSDLTIDADTPYYNGGWTDSASGEVVSDDVVLYYYNSDGWNVVYAYAWSGEGYDTVEYLGVWAGTQMSADDELGEGWFRVEVNAAATNVIFTDGSNKTTDLTIDADTPYYNGGWTADANQ